MKLSRKASFENLPEKYAGSLRILIDYFHHGTGSAGGFLADKRWGTRGPKSWKRIERTLGPKTR